MERGGGADVRHFWERELQCRFSTYQQESGDEELTKSVMVFETSSFHNHLEFQILNGSESCSKVTVSFNDARDKIKSFEMTTISYCATNTSVILIFFKTLADHYDVMINMTDVSRLIFYSFDPEKHRFLTDISLRGLYELCEGRTYYEKYLGPRHGSYKPIPKFYPTVQLHKVEHSLKEKLHEIVRGTSLDRGSEELNNALTIGEIFCFIRQDLRNITTTKNSIKRPKTPKDEATILRYSEVVQLALNTIDIVGKVQRTRSNLADFFHNHDRRYIPGIGVGGGGVGGGEVGGVGVEVGVEVRGVEVGGGGVKVGVGGGEVGVGEEGEGVGGGDEEGIHDTRAIRENTHVLADIKRNAIMAGIHGEYDDDYDREDFGGGSKSRRRKQKRRHHSTRHQPRLYHHHRRHSRKL